MKLTIAITIKQIRNIQTKAKLILFLFLLYLVDHSSMYLNRSEKHETDENQKRHKTILRAYVQRVLMLLLATSFKFIFLLQLLVLAAAASAMMVIQSLKSAGKSKLKKDENASKKSYN